MLIGTKARVGGGNGGVRRAADATPSPPRARGGGGDLIFALHREAMLRRRDGERVIDGTVGVLLDDEGQLIVLPSVRRTVAALDPADWFPYAPLAGEPPFLDAVRREVFGRHPSLHDAAVAVATPGATGAIRHAFRTFLARGQTALTTSHYWPCYADIAGENHRRLETFEMFEGPTCAALDVDALDRGLARVIAKQGRALLLLNDPCHNPTGYSMTAADWNDVTAVVAARARTAPVSVLLDSAYADYGETGLALPLAALERLAGRALVAVAWSASKSLTAYGLRVGALLVVPVAAHERDPLAATLADRGRGSWGNCNRGGMVAVSTILADAALSRAVSSERRAVVDMLAGRSRLFERAAARDGLPAPRTRGGFFAAVLSPDPLRAAAALRRRGLFVVPGRQSLRIALSAVPAADVEAAMKILTSCREQLRT